MTKEEHIELLKSVSNLAQFAEVIGEAINNACPNCASLLTHIKTGIGAAASDLLLIDNNRLFSAGQTTEKVQ